MLRRKPKKRYVLVFVQRSNNEEQNLDVGKRITERFTELYGSVNCAAASFKTIGQTSQTCIIRCSLNSMPEFLVTIAFTNPPMVALCTSGSLRKLKREELDFGFR